MKKTYMYSCCAVNRRGSYKKQDEEAIMAASLWRKKLVLHRSLVGVFIGISEIPIIHAPVPRSREISSAQRGGDHSNEELRRQRTSLAGEAAGAGQFGRPEKRLVEGSSKRNGKSFLDFLNVLIPTRD